MTAATQTERVEARSDSGFAMLIAIFALLIMSTVAVAALMSSGDEARSARATRAANASFYAAEAGLQAFWANDIDSAFVDSLNRGLVVVAPGGRRDFGWRTLSNGGQYHVELRRYDNGGQKIYALVAEGRGARGLAGEQQLSFLVTPVNGTGPYKLGKCCDAAATAYGKTKRDVSGSTISGMDTPPTAWPAARCAATPIQNKPGVEMQDTTQLSRSAGTILTGTPPKKQTPGMDSTAFLQYGGITFAELKAMANHTIDASAAQIKHAVAPTLNVDGTCKTSDPWNWGSSDPAHACYNYFPIILMRGEIEITNGYGQGLVIMDITAGIGSEFELEPPAGKSVTFAGLIVGFGCPEIEDGAKMYGAVYGDGLTANPSCGGDGALRVGDGGAGYLYWSACVAQMVLDRTGTAAASGGIPAGGVKRLSHGFQTLLR